jgi:pimeloyl-ACP methyl ester carboxylesterase
VTALQFSVLHDDQLAALMLCDGTSEINIQSADYLRSRAAAVRNAGIRSLSDQNFKNSFRGLPEPAKNPVWAALRDQFLSNFADSYAMYLEALADMRLKPADFAKVRCRTLCMTGKHDCIWAPAVGEALATSFRMPDMNLSKMRRIFPRYRIPSMLPAVSFDSWRSSMRRVSVGTA